MGINTDSETIVTGHLCVISSYQNCENEGNEIPSYHTCLAIYGIFFLSFFLGGGGFFGGIFPHLFEHIILVIVS